MTSQPQTLTIAQARASTATGLLVADTAANIVSALPNAALTARIASFTVSAGASLSAAQMSLLFPIASRLHATTNSLALSGANIFTAGQLANYESLPGFTLSSTGTVNLSDTMAQVVGLLAAHPAWFAQVSSVTIRLDGSSIGAYPASQLNGLMVHGKSVVFVTSAGHTVLNIAAAAHDLATNAVALNALGVHQILSYTVNNDGAGISAVDATSLTTLRGFSPAVHTLFVSDTGASIGSHLAGLIGQGFARIQVASGTLSATAIQLLDPSVHFVPGAHAQLASSVTLNAATAAALAALPGLSNATGAVLTVSDSAASIVATSSAWQSAAGAVVLNADAVVSAGVAASLSQVATSFSSRFSLSGHSLTISDTLPSLIALPTAAASLATAILLNADATATVAQLTAFQSLPHSGFGGHAIAVTDSAANLLTIAGADLSHISSVNLGGDAVLSATQAVALAAEPNFSAGGHALVVADTAANILTLPSNVLHVITAVELSAAATLSAAAAQVLISQTGYTTDTHPLTISDSAAVLANLTAPVLAFVADEQVSVSATVNVATAAALATLPHLTEAAGVTLTIQDSINNLLSASPSALAVASGVRLVLGSILTTDAAHAASLAAIPGFSSAGSTITVSDSVAHLNAANTLGWSSIATTHAVVDSVDALVLAVGTPLLASAASVALVVPEVVTALKAATLASMPNFASAAQLSVADTTAALISHTASLVSLACPIAVTDSATINVAQAGTLAQIAAASGAGFTFGQHTLTIADTAANLLSLTPAQASLTGSITLTADATLNAAQFGTFQALPHLTLNGHVLTVSDTAAGLSGLSGNLSVLGAAVLSTDANVTASRLASLTALTNFSSAGHTLNVIDTANNLLSLPASDLLQTASAVLSADATVSGQRGVTLTGIPGFSTGGHQLTIGDTAENLLSLPHGLLLSANSLALSGNQNVSAPVLSQLAALGIKFTKAGHSLICIDTAANLAALSQSAVALAYAELLSTSSVVSTATAAALANLPAFSLANGVSLTVQDSVVNLITLGQNVPVCTTAETLVPGTTATIDAQQAAALASLPHFTMLGATLNVTDTIANLNAAGSAVIQAVASAANVSDTAVDLAAGAMSPTVQTANLVSLSGNAVIAASMAAQIASIPHFSVGAYQLEVVDTAANVATQAAAIASVANATLVTGSGPITVSMADQLATLSATHTLSFQGGNQLLVEDSYAALTNSGNSAGLAFASRVGVIDTPSNLISASLHNWGALNPSFTLSQSDVITSGVAISLAGLGSYFSSGGYQLTVADTAAEIVRATSAINSLHLKATITDSAANLGTQATGLLALEASITHISVSDINPITATVAAGLSGLASMLTGPVLHVVGSAMDIQASVGALAELGGHVAISISDSSIDVATYAAILAGLDSHLAITLTDTLPITASIASALAPVALQLSQAGLIVSDTGAAVAAHASALAGMGPAIGVITLSDGHIQSIATAAALARLDSHLDAGTTLTATGTVADVALNQTALTTLSSDAHLAAVLVTNASVSDVEMHLAALNAVSATVSVNDSASDVNAGLSILGQVSNLQVISLTDGAVPSLSMTLTSLASNANTLTKIASPFTITVVDTAAHISADLAANLGSTILGHLGQISQIGTSDSQSVILNQAQVLASNVDDGFGSALNLFTGTVHATDIDVAHLAQVAALPRTPTSIALRDSNLNIAQDLAQEGSSTILNNLGLLTDIEAMPSQTITLTAGQALFTGVDDGPNSALGLIQNLSLTATAVSLADLPRLAQLYTAPSAIAITDTAANLSADLASAASAIVADLSHILSITVSDGMTIMLSEQQVLAAEVDDAAGAALDKVSGAQLAVDHVAAADIATMLGLRKAPSSLSITDTAGHIVSNLTGVVTNIETISSINVTGGTLTLSASEALSSRVDDGTGSLIDRVAGHSFEVVGSTVSQLNILSSLPVAPASISVADSSSNIVADLQSGHSLLAAAGSLLGSITVNHGTLTLTDTQANVVLGNGSLGAVFDHLAPTTIVTVTGVPVGDLATVAASGWPHLAIAVSDSASNIAVDLASGHSALQANSALETSVSLTAGGIVGATTLTAMAALPYFQNAGFALTVHDTASAILGLSPPALSLAQDVEVSDTALMIETKLDLLESAFAGNLSITITDTSPALEIDAGQYVNDRATIDAVTNPAAFTVFGSATALAAMSGDLASNIAVSSVAVQDSAFNVITNLPALSLAGSKLHVLFSDTSITANLVSPLLDSSNLGLPGMQVIDTGSQIAALVESGAVGANAYLNMYGASLSSDSVVSAADAAALEGLNAFSKAGHALIVWDTAQHLSLPAYAAALANSAIDSVHLKTNGGEVMLTAAQAAALFAIHGFVTTNPSGSSNTITVSDTAAHIESELSALASNSPYISSIIVSSNATISDQALSDLQGLGATAAAGVTISVRDTAANIAASANSQAVNHSITATSWTLSGNDTVAESDALILGSLSHFSAGSFILTLALASDTAVSIADANKLGMLAGALNLAGHQLQVAGSVAQLSALSNGALQVVTPLLADTAANIAALPLSSALLLGTVEVTGSEGLSATTATALLSLIHTELGGGVASTALTFDSAHTVYDTVSDLRALTSSAGWMSNALAHSFLHLAAQDSLANLISPANHAFLSGVTSSTITGDVTISIADADSLANSATSIHFDRGNHHILVQGSAQDLINPNNASGIAIGDVIELIGPDHVDAADAEALLTLNHFNLNTTLNIVDSSNNLLDGMLGAVVASSGSGSHIVVQLAGPETLDAQTADNLVNIPGFADIHNLTISDDPSYLLNTSSLSAEQMAVHVTLSEDEMVSANTVLRLSEIPHFSPGGAHLILTSNDFADAATLKAISDMGNAFVANGHSVTMTTNDLDLTPVEFAALRNDSVIQNGHLLGVTPTLAMVSEAASSTQVTGTGVAGGTTSLYDANGSLIASSTHSGAGFATSASDLGHGHNFSLTESAGGLASEGAPLVILDTGLLEDSVAALGGSFASSGQFQVDQGKFVNLYQAGSLPSSMTNAALVYDPMAHTVAIDVPGQGSTILITLGAATHPAGLDASEILFKLHG